jgi:hypothetical protein
VRVVETPHLLLSKDDATITDSNVIWIPEHAGWIHDYRTPPSLDWIQFQMARDLSRAWWGQQVTPAHAVGSQLLTEGLPGLEGLLALDARHPGSSSLHYRNTLADRYLRASALEDRQEAALRAWDTQEYLQSKAPFALYAIAQLVGPDAMDRVLNAFLHRTRNRTAPPYTGSVEFTTLLEDAVTAHREAIREALAEVAVYDIEVSPHLTRSGVLVSGRKFTVRGSDNRAETPFARDVEVTYDGGAAITVPVKNGETMLPLPVRDAVELDPRSLIVDRNRVNNKAQVR